VPSTSASVPPPERALCTPQPVPSTSASVPLPDSPRKILLKRKLSQAQAKNKNMSRKVKTLRESLRRHKKKIHSLKAVIKILEKKNFVCNEQSNILQNLPAVTKEMLARKGNKRVKYSPELRKFAVTLNFFSPKGYNYVRSVFECCLPHPTTIGKWFQSIDANPGFTKESFDALALKVSSSARKILCSLVMDEMSIRQHLEWDGKEYHGYVNFGAELYMDSNELAKDAFVLMVVCVNGRWKLPVGYFLTNSLTGAQKADIIKKCIKLVEDTGIVITSLTFDGAPSNVSMCNLLGCDTNVYNLKTHFNSPGGNKINILYDPCHMLKLVRNTFGEIQNIIDDNNSMISWKYIEKLEHLQEMEGLHLGNKLRSMHVNFFKQKMKVRLAAQLLSASVADSLEYCETELGLNEFKGCGATARFVRTINNIFDILNSRSWVAPGYKKALCPKNIEQTKQFFEEATTYLCQLKFMDGQLIINSNRKIRFIGLIICMASSLLLYKECIIRHQLLYLPLYKTSQDHLELFFSSVRSRGGWNNNPTARQFRAAYKRLLIRAEIREGGVGNCVPLEQIPILECSSRLDNNPERHLGAPYQESPIDDVTSWAIVFKDHEYLMNEVVLNNCSKQIVTYIAGFVVRKLLTTIKCEMCSQTLVGKQENFLNSLITKKKHMVAFYTHQKMLLISAKKLNHLYVWKK